MNEREREIDQTWRRGRQALTAAARALSRRAGEATERAELDVAIAALERGALSRALQALQEVGERDELDAELRTAIVARNRIVELATAEYGALLRRIARTFPRVTDADDAVADVWVKVLHHVFTRDEHGDFRAWLTTIARNTLRDRGDRQSVATRNLELFALEEAVFRGARTGDTSIQGTTRQATRLALQGFLSSLEPEKAELWDAAARLEAAGMGAEEVARTLAEARGRQVSTVKMTLFRLKAELAERLGAPTAERDASEVLALWLSSARLGATTILLAEALDRSDKRWVLATRPAASANAPAFVRMLEALQRAGLPEDRPILVILDDSEGLREAVSARLRCAVIQPCIRTLIESVVTALPPHERLQAQRTAEAAYLVRDVDRTRAQLLRWIDLLKPRHPTIAARLSSALEASLTVKGFALPDTLEQELTRIPTPADGEEPPRTLRERVAAVFVRLRGRHRSRRRAEGLARLAAKLSRG